MSKFAKHFVDVVLVVERVEQLQQPLGVVALHLDRALRLRRKPGGLDLDPGALERFAHRGQVAGSQITRSCSPSSRTSSAPASIATIRSSSP